MAVSSVALRLHYSLSLTTFRAQRKRLLVKGEVAQRTMERVSGDERSGARLSSLLAQSRGSLLEVLKPPDTDATCWPSLAEIAIDKAIINCRFFALIGVVGSLLGSILCFVEGCFLVLESCLQDFHLIFQRVDHGRMLQMVIESTDMFLVGTAMLSFGMGLYSMFVGFNRASRWLGRGSNPFAHLHTQILADASSATASISQVKSRIGFVVVMFLQVGLLEKFKNVPLATGLDLACFAGALLFSSASMFLLSRLNKSSEEGNCVVHRANTM